MRGELFEGIKQWDVKAPGHEGKLPVFYYDNTFMTLIYTASTSRVRELLPRPELHPIELTPGRCLVAFTAFEYRHTDIEPYNELGISFLVQLDKMPLPGLNAGWQLVRRRFTAHVWQLPVTTERARAAGVQLYGYPKFLAEIQFTRGVDRIQCRLAEEGDNILALTGKALPTSRGKLTRFTTYSVLEDVLLSANVVMDPLEYAETRDRRAASLELGPRHPIAEALRKIELSPRPFIYQYAPRMQSILFAARNLIDD